MPCGIATRRRDVAVAGDRPPRVDGRSRGVARPTFRRRVRTPRRRDGSSHQSMKMIYRPTVLTLLGVAATIAAIAGTTGYVLGRAPSLPPVLAGALRRRGHCRPIRAGDVSDRARSGLDSADAGAVFSARLSGLLLYRTHDVRSAVEDELTRQDRERMLMTAEAISLLAAIWVAFQGLLAVRLIIMWQKHVLRSRQHLLSEPGRLHRPVGRRRHQGRGLPQISETRDAGDRRRPLAASRRVFQSPATPRSSCRSAAAPAGPSTSDGRKPLYSLRLSSAFSIWAPIPSFECFSGNKSTPCRCSC